MMAEACDFMMRPLARRLQANHMQWLGITRTQRLAMAYNRMKFRLHDAWRRELYHAQWPQLLRENGPVARPPTKMRDGWAMDTSLTLPHLQRVLADSDRIIAERAGVNCREVSSRSYLQDHWTHDDYKRFPSFIDFATSSDLLQTVACALGCIPALSTVSPAGIRVLESNASFDDEPTRAKENQLYHMDYCSVPTVCVLVLLQDTRFEHGPLTFIPKARSMQISNALGYRSRGRQYFLSDDEAYATVDRTEAIEFAYPRGTVLFMESSSCLHFESRLSVNPSYQLMYVYTGAIRSDFNEIIHKPSVYPAREGDTLLRRLTLNKNFKPS